VAERLPVVCPLGRSRALQKGSAADLADTGSATLLTAGAELLKNNALSSFGYGGGNGAKKADFEPTVEYDEEYDEDEDEEEEEEDEDEDEDANYADLVDDEDEGEEDEDGLDLDDAALGLGGGAAGALAAFGLDAMGLRKKTFTCDIHHVRITNLSRRRRDVQVIFTVGSTPGDGGTRPDHGSSRRAAPRRAVFFLRRPRRRAPPPRTAVPLCSAHTCVASVVRR
jgi:hypothetical protein